MGEMAPTVVAWRPARSNGTENAREDNMINSVRVTVQDAIK